ncbi:MAG: YkgJ family cysteine cluster protein [Deltaproteobacteria bacterium]|nr:YkgJ family cysteine cluster protein [Deltaproteobacteria bacterium]
MSAERSDPPATVAELEEGLRQLHRMEMQTKLQLDRVESLVTAAIKILHRADIVHEKAVEAEAVEQRTKLFAERGEDARVYLGPEVDKYTVDVPDIDCASLMHLCKARCCRLSVALDFKDLDDGLRWEYSRPYELRRRPSDGYCIYSEKETHRCECYDKRPSICRTYDCREDKRVWEDFAAKKPAPWRDDVGVAPPLVQIRMPKSDTR